jgi:hypothetical protein
MCKNNKNTCTHPELKPEHGKCSEEQIQKCHGDNKEHPCKSEKQ